MKRMFAALLMIVFLLSGCASSPVSYAPADDFYGYEMPAPAEAVYEEKISLDAPVSIENSVPAQKRMVIENADLSIVVADPQARMQAIVAMSERMGGFVVSSNIYETYLPGGGKAPEGSMTIRIPAERLNDALNEIKADIVELQSETRSGQDVTQEYTDLASRLKNLESTERQLTAIMEDANKTEDVLQVFRELTQIREQIEIIKGQMQYYEQSAALSSVSIRLIAEKTIQPIEIGGWKPQGVVRDAAQALVNFLQGFFEFVVWLVIVFLPAAILILGSLGLVLFVVWRFARWLWRLLFKGKGKQAMTPEAEEKAG